MGRLHRDSLPGLAGPGKGFPCFCGTCLSGPGACICSIASCRGYCSLRTVRDSPYLAREASTCEVPGSLVPWWAPLPGNPEAVALLPETDLFSAGSQAGLSDGVHLVQVSLRGRTRNSEGSCLPVYFRIESRKKKADRGTGRRESLSL